MPASEKMNRSSRKKGQSRGLEVAKARFAGVVEGSVNTSIDPRACIPLTRIRGYSRSGILRLKRLFAGRDTSQTSSESVGFVAGSDCPIVIRMEGTYVHNLITHLQETQGLNHEEAKLRFESKEKWFGVVDGMHRVMALLELIREDPDRWDGFSMPVTVLKGGYDLQTLKQLARQQNKKHSEVHYIETTLYDHLRGLKDEAGHLREHLNRKPSGREVVEAYDGQSEFKDQTMLQMANTAMRLSDTVIEAIGRIMSSEHPELVQIPADLVHTLQRGDNESIMDAVDCRVYRKFVNLTSIKSATAFMKAGEGNAEAEESQINTLHRCKEICRSQNFKAVSHKLVAQQYERSCQAMQECKKLEQIMETQKWPEELKAIRTNVLRSTKFDDDIARNAGNDAHVLPILLEQYVKAFPGVADSKIQKYEALREVHDKEVQEGAELFIPIDHSEKPEELDDGEADNRRAVAKNEQSKGSENEDASNADRADGENTERDAENFPARGKEKGKVVPLRQRQENSTVTVQATASSERLNVGSNNVGDGMSVLKALSISTHQMKWQEYDASVQSDKTVLFDMLLTDPPYGLQKNSSGAGTRYTDYVDEKEMKQLAEFARRSLVPGGYVFLFCSHTYFPLWMAAFQGTSFLCMKYPFVIHKDGDTMQGYRNEDFPQNNCEYGLVARAPGGAKNGFKPDFVSPYNMIPCKQKRRFASLIECPVPRTKLTNGTTKSPLLTEEKNPKLLIELLQTFSPPGGRTLDCYGGTLTTALACIKSGRKCSVIEKDVEIYKLAVERLIKIGKGHTSLEGIKKRRTSYEENKKGQDCATQTGMTENAESTRVDEDEPSTSGGDNRIRGGSSVWLLVDGQKVGTAKVQECNTHERKLKTSIHGEPLSSLAGEGEFLVAVLQVVVEEEEIETVYPYVFKSLDDIPRTLGEIMKNGIYAWDLNSMELRE